MNTFLESYITLQSIQISFFQMLAVSLSATSKYSWVNTADLIMSELTINQNYSSFNCIALIAYLPLKKLILWPPNRLRMQRKPAGVSMTGDRQDILHHRWAWLLHSSTTWPGPGRQRRWRGSRL